MSQFPSLPGGKDDKASFTDLDSLYKIGSDQYSNWWASLPYGFRITLKSGESKIMYLPVNPNNINITTHMATNIVTTLYGVVEEHSDIRYHDIVIQGTTGYMPENFEPIDAPSSPGAPKNKKSFGARLADGVVDIVKKFIPGEDNKKDPVRPGRQAAQGNESDADRVISEVSAIFPRTAGIIKQAANMFMSSSSMRKGTDQRASGYVAFHNLQRMLMAYKQDASSAKPGSGVHPIQFLNNKDKIQYDCAPVQFSVTRSADSPMLYNYSIMFRAYNLRAIDEKVAATAKKDQLESLGLSGYGNSLIKGAKKLAGKATSLVGAAKSIGGGKK